MFCKYSDIFGRPGEGPHEMRIGRFAAVDIGATLVGAGLLGYFLDFGIQGTTLLTIILFIIGTLLHIMFGVQTAGLTFLGIQAGCSKS